VPRLHLGLKVSSIKLLHSSHKEKISCKFNINAGLIVQEVYLVVDYFVESYFSTNRTTGTEGSAAEKFGIRNGDVIESLNGKCFPTTVEVSVLHMCYVPVSEVERISYPIFSNYLIDPSCHALSS